MCVCECVLLSVCVCVPGVVAERGGGDGGAEGPVCTGVTQRRTVAGCRYENQPSRNSGNCIFHLPQFLFYIILG